MATNKAKPRQDKRTTIRQAAQRATPATTKPTPTKAPRRPVTERDRARVRALHAQGVGRNEIARQIGRSVATVTKIVREAGGQFDDSMTAQAVEIRSKRMKERRLEIAEILLDDVAKLRERAWSEHSYYERAAEQLIPVTLPLPPLRDVRDAYASMGLALRGHTDLVRESAGAANENKRSVLADLFEGIKAAATADAAAHPDVVEATMSTEGLT